MKRRLLTLALLLVAAGCGRRMPDENPSCCFYECEGPRQQWFSSYFGSEAECNEVAEFRCGFEHPETPGVKRIQYSGGVEYDDMQGLNPVCETLFTSGFEVVTSTRS